MHLADNNRMVYLHLQHHIDLQVRSWRGGKKINMAGAGLAEAVLMDCVCLLFLDHGRVHLQ